jgi:hypothetical protein
MDDAKPETADPEGTHYRRLMEAGADITGNLAGSALGFLVAGPAGALAGAAASPIVKHLVALASDVIRRTMSTRETKRIGATLAFAAAKIQEKLDSGQQPRDDGFFASDSHQRAAADEIAEGVVIAAQREHEEKKLKFYGNLLANLAFVPGIDRGYSNFLLKSAENLSYRQLCLLALFVLKNSIQGGHLRQTSYRPAQGTQNVNIPLTTVPLLYEIFDLYSRGLISGGGGALLGLTDINPSEIVVQGAGSVLVNLMELLTIDLPDLNALIPALS